MGGNIAKNKKRRFQSTGRRHLAMKIVNFHGSNLMSVFSMKRMIRMSRSVKRLSFASIFQSNLDEFFMVRVGSLHDQMLFSETKRESKYKYDSWGAAQSYF